jgi:hypothetical protein
VGRAVDASREPAVVTLSAILLLAVFGVRYNKEQEIIPVWENKSPEESPQSVVKLVPTSEIRTGFYKVFIAEYHKSVN